MNFLNIIKSGLPCMLLLVGLATGLKAQEQTTNKSSFKIGADYLSNNVFLGRTDTVATPIITPTLGYTFGFGLFLNATAEYIPSRAVHKLDGGNLQIGYNFSFSDQFEGSISYSKLFYAATSTQISSSISSTTNLALDYNIKDIVTLAYSMDYNIGKGKSKNDFLVTPGISHDFLIEGVLGESNFLLITPTVALNAGTQNFYDSYFKNKKGAKYKAYNKSQAAERINLSNFNLLDYEFSLPVNYSVKPFLFSITPTCAIPENKLPGTITAGQAKNGYVFYGDFGITVKF